jgi:hypothetical protein
MDEKYVLNWMVMGANTYLGTKNMLNSDENCVLFYICFCFDILKLC